MPWLRTRSWDRRDGIFRAPQVASNCSTLSTLLRISPGFSVNPLRRFGCRFDIATSLMPGIEFRICSAMPRPIKPAPTIATRTGFLSRSLCCNAQSTIIMFDLSDIQSL